MHEKDVQLAQLLIARQTELRASGDSLREQAEAVRKRIDNLRAQAEERNQYADILARAADLLQRSDLTVEAPDTSAEEAELAGLTTQLDELDAQETQFRELVEALRERAPQLFDAATGELSMPAASPADLVSRAAVEPAPTDEAGTLEPAVSGPDGDSVNEDVADTGPDGGQDWDESVKVYVAGRSRELSQEDEEYLARMPAASEPADPAPASAPDEPLNEEELDRFLARFNMDVIQRQMLQSLAQDACFVVDAASVMNNIPYYDHSIRGGPVKTIRDEMLRDFGLLARHLDRSVHLVLDQEHAPEAALNSRLTLQTLRGSDQGQRSAQDTLLKSVLADAAQRSQVCLVTGELALGGSLRSRRVQFLPLTDFYRM